MQKNQIRCPWCGTDPLYVAYHDEEWGRPVHDDATLFEFLTLEGAQAGLSWITVLRKRENYREVFHHWNIEKIADMKDGELEEILLNPGVVRNRLKIYSVRKNAKVALEIQKEFGSLDTYFWGKGWFDLTDANLGILDSSYPKGTSNSSKRGAAQNDGKRNIFPIRNSPKEMSHLPSESHISKAISKDLKKRGMTFVGSTIIYAFMQAVGMVDDHLDTCFRKSI